MDIFDDVVVKTDVCRDHFASVLTFNIASLLRLARKISDIHVILIYELMPETREEISNKAFAIKRVALMFCKSKVSIGCKFSDSKYFSWKSLQKRNWRFAVSIIYTNLKRRFQCHQLTLQLVVLPYAPAETQVFLFFGKILWIGKSSKSKIMKEWSIRQW